MVALTLSVCWAPDFLFITSTIRRYDVCWNEVQFKASLSEAFTKDTRKKIRSQKLRQQFKKRKQKAWLDSKPTLQLLMGLKDPDGNHQSIIVMVACIPQLSKALLIPRSVTEHKSAWILSTRVLEKRAINRKQITEVRNCESPTSLFILVNGWL